MSKKHALHIQEKDAARWGAKEGDEVRAVSEGAHLQAVRDNLRCIIGTGDAKISFPLIGPEGAGVQPGDIMVIKIKKQEVFIARYLFEKYGLTNQESGFTIKRDREMPSYMNTYILVGDKRISLFELGVDFPDNYREGDIIHFKYL